jgi:hypothetical protein
MRRVVKTKNLIIFLTKKKRGISFCRFSFTEPLIPQEGDLRTAAKRNTPKKKGEPT